MKQILIVIVIVSNFSVLFGQIDTTKLTKLDWGKNVDSSNVKNDDKAKTKGITNIELFDIYSQIVVTDIDRYGATFDKLLVELNNYYEEKNLIDSIILLRTKMVATVEQLVHNYPKEEYFVKALSVNYQLVGYYCNVQGRFEEAEKAYLMSIKIIQPIVKNDKNLINDLSNTKNGLGNTYIAWKKYDEAIKVFNEVVQIFEQLNVDTTNNYDIDIAIVKNSLGISNYKLNKFDAAKKVYFDAIKIRKKYQVGNVANNESLKINQMEIAAILGNLGNIYDVSKEYTEAEKCYLESLDLKKNLAIQDPVTYKQKVLFTCVDIAIHYFNRMKTEKTLKYKQKALEKLDEAELNRSLYPETVDFSKSYKALIESLKLNVETYKN
jgi:tetratricopeptide (TPR) repeat protein